MTKTHTTHGTREEHLETLRRACSRGLSYVWSGDLRRNEYLRENVLFGVSEGIISVKDVTMDQESGVDITWLRTDF